MKKTTKLLSLLCAVAAVIMMIPMQLAVGAEEVVTDPAAGTVYTLDKFGTEAKFGQFSFGFTNDTDPNKVPTTLIELTTIQDVSDWPAGKRYLTAEEAAAETKPTHLWLEGTDKSMMVKANQLQVIVFTAPTCGRYTYDFTVRADWSGDTKLAVLCNGEFKKDAVCRAAQTPASATDVLDMKAGDKAYFIGLLTMGNGSDPMRIDKFQITLNEVTHTASEVLEENRVEPTCADGSVDKVTRCTKCNVLLSKTTDILPKVADKHKGPELTRNVNVVPATCQTEGSHDVETYCEYCNTVIKTEPVTDPKLTDHTPEAGDPVKENEVAATCHSEGSYDLVTRCKTCGGVMATEHKTTEKTAHTPGAAVRENENLPTVVGKAGSYDEVVYCSVPECRAEISRKTVKVYLKKVNYTLKNFGKTTSFSSNNLSLMFTTDGNGTDIGSAVGRFADTLKPLNKLTDVGGGKRYTLGGNDKFKHAELVDGEKRIYAENGGFNVIVFTAPEDGTYTYEFSGHNAWGNDIELAVNINGNSSTWGKSVNGAFGSTGKASDTVNLKKGEKIFFVPRLTAGADQAGQHDYFVLESFSVSTVKYVEKQPVNPGTGTYIAASVFACAAAAVVCTVAAKKKKSIFKANNLMKKLLLIFLALTFAVSAAACAGDPGKKPAQSSGAVTSGGGTSEDDPYKNIPVDLRFDGEDFVVGMQSGTQYEFYIEEDSDDAISSALYKRNQTVENRFGITIKPQYSAEGTDLYTHTNELIRNIMSGEKAYDLISAKVVASGGLVLNNCLYDWTEMKYNDGLRGSAWIDSINDELQIQDHIFTAVGQTCISALRWTYAIMFNRTQADNRQITENVFNAIDSGDWTIDYFNSLVAGIYEDIDDVNGRSEYDFYGFNAEALTNLDTFQFAFDIPMIVKDKDEILSLAFGTEKTVDAVDKVIRLYWNNPGTFICDDTAVGTEGRNFVEGRSIFAIMTLDTCFTGLRDMNDHYAVLPFPKYDADQKEYLTGMMDNYSIMGIPTDAANPDMSSAVAEALNIEAERIMYPVWYDESLSTKFQRDEYTVKYLDLLIAGRKADMGTLFQESLGRIAMLFRDTVRTKQNGFQSSWDGNKDALNASLKEIIDTYIKNTGANS